jgi:hypothetical protein
LLVLRITQAGIELGLRPWVATTDLLAAQGELLAAVHAALQRERIALAQPLRLLHAIDPDSIR